MGLGLIVNFTVNEERVTWFDFSGRFDVIVRHDQDGADFGNVH